MRVHSALGNGFQEVIYQRALEIEMPYENLSLQREMEMPVYYRNRQIGTRRVDFFIPKPIRFIEAHPGNMNGCIFMGKTESEIQQPSELGYVG